MSYFLSLQSVKHLSKVLDTFSDDLRYLYIQGRDQGYIPEQERTPRQQAAFELWHRVTCQVRQMTQAHFESLKGKDWYIFYFTYMRTCYPNVEVVDETYDWSNEMVQFLLDSLESIRVLSQSLGSVENLAGDFSDDFYAYIRQTNVVYFERIRDLLSKLGIEVEFQSAFEQRFGYVTLEEFFKTLKQAGSNDWRYLHVRLSYNIVRQCAEDRTKFNLALRHLYDELTSFDRAMNIQTLTQEWWASMLRIILEYGPYLVSNELDKIVRDDEYPEHKNYLRTIRECLSNSADYISFRMSEADYASVLQEFPHGEFQFAKADLKLFLKSQILK